MPDTKTVRRRNLPLVLLGLAPSLLLAACNTQEKQEMAAAIARAEDAAQRAENAQHLAEAAAARARTDKLAAAQNDQSQSQPPADEQKHDQEPEVNPAQPQDNQQPASKPG